MKTMTQRVRVKFRTITKTRLAGELTLRTKVLQAIAVDRHGNTIERKTSAGRLGDWLAAQGFELVTGSAGTYQRVVPL